MLRNLVLLVFICILINQATKLLNAITSVLKELVKLFK